MPIERGIVHTHTIFIQNKHTVLSILNNMESSSKAFHKGLSKFQNQTEQQSDLGGKVLFLIILSRVAWSRETEKETNPNNMQV